MIVQIHINLNVEQTCLPVGIKYALFFYVLYYVNDFILQDVL
jgi:hypothetical protein